jgi:hypothetical protein
MNGNAAMERAQRISGDMGYILMGIGNAGVVFFALTLGLANQLVYADVVWCIVLDSAAVALTVYMWWKEKQEDTHFLYTREIL